MKKECQGVKGRNPTRHASLFDGAANKGQVYPTELCIVICKGLQKQIATDRRGQFVIAEIRVQDAKEAMKEREEILRSLLYRRYSSDTGIDGHMCEAISRPATLVARQIFGRIGADKSHNHKEPGTINNLDHPTATEDMDEWLEQAWDDVSGAELDPKEGRKAGQEEVEYIHKSRLYTKVPRSKAKSLGAKVTTVRWIDINQGDTQSPNYRPRLVAREINTNKRMDLFVATPPLEALKLVRSTLTSGNKGEKLMINYVSRAFFCAPARGQVFVELPEEDREEEDMVGELNYSMYGTRDTAQNWG